MEDVLRELDARARDDPRLERFRVVGRGDAMRSIPPGWHVSSAVERIAVAGGWWPGEWEFPSIAADVVGGWLTFQNVDDWVGQVRWVGMGTSWERAHFFTPMTQSVQRSAPVLGLSSQALWASLVFPSEAALLMAFLITYDEMGLDDMGGVDPFFVEWVTDAPAPGASAGAQRAGARIQEQVGSWSSSHPCWNPSVMPLLSDDPWPTSAVASALGVDRS